MFEFIFGVAVGSAFAPFWMGLWNNFVKPIVTKVLNRPKQ